MAAEAERVVFDASFAPRRSSILMARLALVLNSRAREA
jgi:hypothetical protein